MKECPNPDCPVHQAGRPFNADDMICPRCGTELVTVGTAPRPARTTDPALGRTLSVLWAIVILLFVFGVVLGAAGLMKWLTPGTAATPVINGAIPEPTLLALADATHTAVANDLPNTPVGVVPTPVVFVTPLQPSTGSINSGGSLPSGSTVNSGTSPNISYDTGAAGATSAVIPGVSGTRLCRRVAGGEPCEPVSSYSTRDSFNLAVQAGFGTGGARSARVRWYGPTGTLLYATEPVVPGRTGTYWVAFTLTQSQPWTQGLYRAEIYLDDTLARQVDIPVVP